MLGSHQVRAGWGCMRSNSKTGEAHPGCVITFFTGIPHQVLTHSFLSPWPPSLHVGAAVKRIHRPASESYPEKMTILGRRGDRVSERVTRS